jgi:hypothetical protein
MRVLVLVYPSSGPRRQLLRAYGVRARTHCDVSGVLLLHEHCTHSCNGSRLTPRGSPAWRDWLHTVPPADGSLSSRPFQSEVVMLASSPGLREYEVLHSTRTRKNVRVSNAGAGDPQDRVLCTSHVGKKRKKLTMLRCEADGILYLFPESPRDTSAWRDFAATNGCLDVSPPTCV